MNIINSTYSNQALQNTQGVKKAKQQANIKPVIARDEQNNNSNNVDKNKPRFDVSENAIALLQEQGQANGSMFSGTSSNSQFSHHSNNQASGQQPQYDQPSKQNLSAVAAYESVDNIAQRENVKQFFGINLFA